MGAGDKLKELRISKGFTLEELGQKVGVGKSTIRKWEQGMIANIKADKVQKLADALEVDPVFIIGLYGESLRNAPHACESAPKSDFTADEVKVINNYRKLSKNGKYEVMKRIDELLQLETIGKKGERAI